MTKWPASVEPGDGGPSSLRGRTSIDVMAGSRRYTLTAAAGSVAAGLIGGAGLLGYMPGLRILGSFRADYVPMAPSTALGVLILSATLYRHARRPWSGTGMHVTVGLAMLVMAYGALSFMGQLLGTSLTPDVWVSRGLGTIGTIPIGRMSPLTGAALALTGLGTALLLRQGRPQREELLGHWVSSLGGLAVAMAATMLLSYVYGVPLGYAGGRIVPMAATTSCAVLCLGVALVTLAGPTSFSLRLLMGSSTSAALARRFVPLVVAAVPLHDLLRWAAGRWMWYNEALESAILAVIMIALAVYAVTHVSHLVGDRLDRIARALRESEERYRAITHTANEAIITADDDGKIADWNPGAAAMFGYVTSEALGQSIGVLMPASLRAAHASGLARVASGGARHVVGRTIEVQGQRKDGTIFPMELSLAVWTTEAGQHFTGVIRDITERDRLVRERIALQGQLANTRKMEAIGLLAGGVAHEFNNSLAAILGYAELTMRALGRGHAAYAGVEAIRNTAQRSAELTGQLLAYARRQQITLEPLDLNDAIGGRLDALRATLGDAATLVWAPDDALWPIAGDRARIEEMLAGLALNARDAATQPGCTIAVTTSNARIDAAFIASHADARVGEFARVRVRDNGDGMDPQVLARVFEPFFTTKPPGKGTGMGLPTVHGIMEQHHGFVTIDSARGAGTTVDLHFPRMIDAPTGAAIAR